MKQIKDLLHNNKKTYIQITEMQSICAKTITEIIHFQISPTKIQYKNSTLIISAPPIVKTEIHIHKTKILEKLQQQEITITAIN